MKIALVHDYLTQRGGVERVFELGKYPNADIFTSVYDPNHWSEGSSPHNCTSEHSGAAKYLESSSILQPFEPWICKTMIWLSVAAAAK